MQNDDFIKNLAHDLEPRVAIATPAKHLSLWLLGSITLLKGALALHTLRPDLAQMMGHATYNFEYLTSFSLALVAAYMALALRIPGSKGSFKTLVLAMMLWISSIVIHSLSMASILRFEYKSSLACASWIIAWGLLPGFGLYLGVKKGASTQPRLALALVALAAASIAAGSLTFACNNDGLIHLLLGHASPLGLALVLGLASGRRLLRW